jgi:hypothetical protein
VLFGLDEHGKPKAARFDDTEAKLVTKVAEQMRLKVLTITDPAVAEIAAQLPAGRIHARSRGVVPHVRADLYAKLVTAAAADGASNDPPAQRPPNTPPSGTPPTGGDGRLPPNWENISPGHLVLANESHEDGWYEAIVVERTGEMVVVKWRDFPRERRFTRHYRALALLCPSPADIAAPAPGKTGRPGTAKAGAGNPASGTQPLPTTWAQIDVASLVLAQQDGPWPAWWEAIPTENNGATLTLRWRDYAKLPAITRARTSLALIYPSAT